MPMAATTATPVVEKVTYTIKYDANGGTGAPGNQTKTHDTALTLSSTKPTRSSTTANGYTLTFNGNNGTPSKTSATATNTTSYSFKNWNTNSGGTGTSYSSGGSYTANAAATLYAQWNSSVSNGSVTMATATRSSGSETAAVTINANGGSSSVTSLSTTRAITYTCKGWYTAASGGTKRADAGATYTPTATETLYAQWTPTNGTYSAVTLPTSEQCKREGYNLLGFAGSASATAPDFAPGAQITPTGAQTLYAVWGNAGILRIGANVYTPYVYYNGQWVTATPYAYVDGKWVEGI